MIIKTVTVSTIVRISKGEWAMIVRKLPLVDPGTKRRTQFIITKMNIFPQFIINRTKILGRKPAKTRASILLIARTELVWNRT